MLPYHKLTENLVERVISTQYFLVHVLSQIDGITSPKRFANQLLSSLEFRSFEIWMNRFKLNGTFYILWLNKIYDFLGSRYDFLSMDEKKKEEDRIINGKEFNCYLSEVCRSAIIQAFWNFFFIFVGWFGEWDCWTTSNFKDQRHSWVDSKKIEQWNDPTLHQNFLPQRLHWIW